MIKYYGSKTINLNFRFSVHIDFDLNTDFIRNYFEYREKYAAKRTSGLANAVARCDEFLVDPVVRIQAFSFLVLLLINLIILQNSTDFLSQCASRFYR